MHFKSFDYKYFTILIISLIKSIKIIVLKILKIAPTLGITNTRSLNPAFLINTIIYIRFDLLKSCLYMYDSTKSFNNTGIYSSIFEMIVNISISTTRKIFAK